MADIFISYAIEDRPHAELLAKAFDAYGWSVWFDRAIPPGQHFSKVIEKKLADARCVVVVWSRTSVDSDWVYEEAEVGKRRGILIPVRLT